MSEDTTLTAMKAEATMDGAYVETPFQAIVRNAKARQGKTPSKCELIDPANPRVKAKAAWFGGSFLDLQGSVVRFAGKSIKAKLYEGELEMTIGEKASVTPVGDAPQGAGESSAPQASPGAGTGRQAPPPAQREPVDPVAYFHREMRKQSLFWLHCWQYGRDVAIKTKPEIPPEQFQGMVASLFIEGNRRGLSDRPPALREVDGVGFKTFVAPKPVGPTQAEIDAEAKKKAEAAAAEEERRHKEEAEKRRKAAEQDEDVPF